MSSQNTLFTEINTYGNSKNTCISENLIGIANKNTLLNEKNTSAMSKNTFADGNRTGVFAARIPCCVENT